MLGRHRLPAPRHVPAEPHRPHRRPGHEGDHRGRPGDRRELRAPRRAQTVRANAEVILSGGAVNSPQLLMLSGIGPAEHLIEMGIDVVSESRGVGENLGDHPVLPVIWSTPGSAACGRRRGTRTSCAGS